MPTTNQTTVTAPDLTPDPWRNTDPYYQRAFQTSDDESIITTYNNFTGQFWFAITDRRLIAVNFDRRAKPPPGTEWKVDHPPTDRPIGITEAGSWDLSDVRGFHVVPRPDAWWFADSYREIFRVDARTSPLTLRGRCDFPIGISYYRIDRPASVHHFAAVLKAAVAIAAPKAPPISLTLPAIVTETSNQIETMIPQPPPSPTDDVAAAIRELARAIPALKPAKPFESGRMAYHGEQIAKLEWRWYPIILKWVAIAIVIAVIYFFVT
jgi:hypothetical protein